mmetsp:Transcript_41753/g.110126  ORF Transcript_41753/g.110126 Transcript_41753/m.110126 type:complete len:257 (+) Transcript_41753:226-996(+)
MIPMRSQSASASSMECVVSTTQRPLVMLEMILHKTCLVSGSRPVEGSSKKTTHGFAMSAMPRDKRRRMPPESCDAFMRSGSPSSPTASATWRASALSWSLGMPLMRAKRRKCSKTVRSCQTMSNCGQMPKTWWMRLISVRALKLPTLASPPVMPWLPDSIEMMVVLPAPFGPRRPKQEFVGMPKETPCTAWWPPGYSFTKLRTWTVSPAESPDATRAASALTSSSMEDASADDALVSFPRSRAMLSISNNEKVPCR